MKVTASYSRTISHSNYGGEPYETSRYSATFENDIEITDEGDKKVAYDALYAEAYKLVEAKVSDVIAELGDTVEWLEVSQVLSDMLEGNDLTFTPDDYARCTDVQKAVIQNVKRFTKRGNKPLKKNA